MRNALFAATLGLATLSSLPAHAMVTVVPPLDQPPLRFDGTGDEHIATSGFLGPDVAYSSPARRFFVAWAQPGSNELGIYIAQQAYAVPLPTAGSLLKAVVLTGAQPNVTSFALAATQGALPKLLLTWTAQGRIFYQFFSPGSAAITPVGNPKEIVLTPALGSAANNIAAACSNAKCEIAAEVRTGASGTTAAITVLHVAFDLTTSPTTADLTMDPLDTNILASSRVLPDITPGGATGEFAFVWTRMTTNGLAPVLHTLADRTSTFFSTTNIPTDPRISVSTSIDGFHLAAWQETSQLKFLVGTLGGPFFSGVSPHAIQMSTGAETTWNGEHFLLLGRTFLDGRLAGMVATTTGTPMIPETFFTTGSGETLFGNALPMRTASNTTGITLMAYAVANSGRAEVRGRFLKDDEVTCTSDGDCDSALGTSCAVCRSSVCVAVADCSDAGVADASDDASGNDASGDDATITDVANADVPDSGTSSEPGYMLKVRGSGCSCETRSPTRSRSAPGLAAVVGLAVACTRARRRSRA